MITVYHIDENKVYTGYSKQVSKEKGLSKNWTRVQPPSVNADQYAVFDDRKWFIADSYPIQQVNRIQSVQMRQVRLQMNEEGTLQTFESGIPNEPNASELEIEWEYATEVTFDGVIAVAMRNILSLDDEGLYTFFKKAASR